MRDIIVTFYDTRATNRFANNLDKNKITYTYRDVLNDFWGVEFNIKPRNRKEEKYVFDLKESF